MKFLAAAVALSLIVWVASLFLGTPSPPAGPSLQRTTSRSQDRQGVDLANVDSASDPRVSSDRVTPPPGLEQEENESEPLEETLPGDLHHGLVVRVEDFVETGVPKAHVTVHWRAGSYDYRDFEGVTDERGQLVTPLVSAFQVEAVEVVPKGTTAEYGNASNDTVADLREAGMLRFMLPNVREVELHARDERGADIENAEIKIERKKTLPLSAGVNLLRRSDDLDVKADAEGRARLRLEMGAYEAAAEPIPGQGRAEVAFGVEYGSGLQEIELRFETPEPRPRNLGSAKEVTEKVPVVPTKGRVVDERTGDPIAGAELQFANQIRRNGSGGGFRTDAGGYFEAIDTWSPRRSYLLCSAKGYSVAAVHLGGSERQAPLLISMGAAAVIRGVAVDENGAPVQGTAHVFLPVDRVAQGPGQTPAPNDGRFFTKPLKASTTGPAGQIHFSRLTRDLHRIWFQPEDTSLPPKECFVMGGDLGVVITVGEEPEGLGTLKGTLLIADTEAPAPGLDFILSGEHTPLRVKTRSDEFGHFTVKGLAPGTFEYRIRHVADSAGMTPFAFKEATLEVQPGDQERVFPVDLARKLQLQLVGSSPQSVPRGATVAAFTSDGKLIELQSDAGYEDGDSADADWNGRLNLWGLPAREIEIRAWLSGADEREDPPAGTWAVDLSEPRPEIIRLRLDS